MKAKADKSNNENQGKTAKAIALQKSTGKNSLEMADNREVSSSQTELQMMIDHSPRMIVQRRQLERSYDTPVQGKGMEEEEELMQGKFIAQRAEIEDEELLQGKFGTVQCKTPEEEELLQGKVDTIQRQSLEEEEEPLQGKFSAGTSPIQLQEGTTQSGNQTGVPDQLKAGIESISGMDMSDVRVHYNSSKPAQLNALAYAQGNDIHLGSGQEQHLPHEAWHTVQQRQGRVRPTMQMAGAHINDDPSLEKEADVMGAKALQQKNEPVEQNVPKKVCKPTSQRMTARIRRDEKRDPTPEEVEAARQRGRANSERVAGHGRGPHGRRREAPAERQERQAEADRVAAEEQAIQLKTNHKKKGSAPLIQGLELETDMMVAKPMQIRGSEKSAFQFPNHAEVGPSGSVGGPIGEPIQRLTIRKFEVKNKDALASFFGMQSVFDTDALEADKLEKLIGLLKADVTYKSKVKQVAALEKQLARLKPISPTASSNPIVAALAKRFEDIDWKEGDKPKLEFVAQGELTTTAFYDPNSNTIKASKDENDEAKLWDNILFEAQNARNRELFKVAKKGAGGGSTKTLTEYGLEYAGIEYNSFKKYVTGLRAIIRGGVDKSSLPDQAQKALTKMDEYDELPSEDERKQKFVNAPHKEGDQGKAGLSSADLYAYEAVEGWDKNTRNSRITTVVRSLYIDIVGHNFTLEPVKSIKAVYTDAAWPLDAKKGSRPHAFQLVVKAVVAKARAITPANQAEKQKLEKLANKLESLYLSQSAQQVASRALV